MSLHEVGVVVGRLLPLAAGILLVWWVSRRIRERKQREQEEYKI